MISLQAITEQIHSAGLIPHASDLECDDDYSVLIEAWHRERKVSVYWNPERAMLLRVWGSNIIREMSEHDIQFPKDIDGHLMWLKGCS